MRHVETYPHTLLPRFMGAHRLIVPELGKVRLIRTTSDVLLATGDLNDYLLLSYHVYFPTMYFPTMYFLAMCL